MNSTRYRLKPNVVPLIALKRMGYTYRKRQVVAGTTWGGFFISPDQKVFIAWPVIQCASAAGEITPNSAADTLDDIMPEIQRLLDAGFAEPITPEDHLGKDIRTPESRRILDVHNPEEHQMDDVVTRKKETS